MIRNDKNELIPPRVQSGWLVCIDYRKLNAATRKDNFSLPLDQMLERLAGQSFYCFLDGYFSYSQISTTPEDEEKTTFTCPFGTYAFRRMPFGLCSVPATLQSCMISIFSDLVEQCMKIFMNDFSVFGSSFDDCLSNLRKVLERYREKNLTLNCEKCHFMVKKDIVLGHIISRDEIKVDKAKTDLIVILSPLTCMKEVRSFPGYVGLYRRFIKDFSKIAKPLSNLLAKDVPIYFSKECRKPFSKLKKTLTSSPILHPPI